MEVAQKGVEWGFGYLRDATYGRGRVLWDRGSSSRLVAGRDFAKREESSRGGRVWRLASTVPLDFRVPLRASPAQILGHSAVLGARTANTHHHWAHLTAATQRKHVH